MFYYQTILALMERLILIKMEQGGVFSFFKLHIPIYKYVDIPSVTILSFALGRSKRRNVDYGLFSHQSHIETCVDSSDLNYPDQCRPSVFFPTVYIYWSSDHSEIRDS